MFFSRRCAPHDKGVSRTKLVSVFVWNAFWFSAFFLRRDSPQPRSESGEAVRQMALLKAQGTVCPQKPTPNGSHEERCSSPIRSRKWCFLSSESGAAVVGLPKRGKATPKRWFQGTVDGDSDGLPMAGDGWKNGTSLQIPFRKRDLV